MVFAVTKVSSKGQIVIPVEMREGINEGDRLLLIKNGKNIIIKNSNDVEEKLMEDLEFARRTDEVLESYYKNPESFKKMDAKDFLEEIKKW